MKNGESPIRAVHARTRPETKGRYLSSQKLSNYQIEKIIAAYALNALEGRGSVEAVALKLGYSKTTVARIFALLRHRLAEIQFYPDPKAFWDFVRRTVREDPSFAFSDVLSRLESRIGRGFPGAPADQLRFFLAEAIFCAENPELTPAAFLRDIKVAVRITGPLNIPPRRLPEWHNRQALQTISQQINDLRRKQRKLPELDEKQRVILERLIEERARKARTLRQLERSQKNAGPTSE